MSSIGTGLNAGALRLQVYNNFRGVDFTDENVNESRSPDALNMWKNYKTLGKKIETRPGIVNKLTETYTIFGLFFYTINNVDHWIIHEGVKLIDYNPTTETTTILKATGMNTRKSVGFVFNNILFIKDGLNYLEYNGTTLTDVSGTIPNIAIHNIISGETKMIQEANLLTDYVTEQYIPDGNETTFYLSQKGVSNISVWDISGVTPVVISTGYTTDTSAGKVVFDTAPTLSTNGATIEIKYSKTSDGATMVKKCTLACQFDNRVFFSGNPDYPNMLIWCGLNDPRYIGVTNYSTQGTDISQIKALAPGNNALWTFKEPSQENTTIFYNVPVEVYDSKLEQTIKTYASSHSSISTGCVSTGVNFNDDICFFSDRGLEGISSDITTEQAIAHRSTLIDSKLLSDSNYKNLEICEWEGYLLVSLGNKVYLADSHQRVQNNDHMEYEWFYWDLGVDINVMREHNGILYIGTKEKTIDGVTTSHIYSLTDNEDDREIESYWCTKKDDFGYPQMLKTTNKKGFKSEVSGTTIKIETKLDNNDFVELGTFTNTKGYIVTKLKRKKWNKMQLKYSSTKPFGLYSAVVESYIGSYVKR